MKVLVTGATGYVGSHTAAALTEQGHSVRVLARTPARVPSTSAPFDLDSEVATGDMTDARAVSAAVDGCDAVVHAAGEVGVSGGTGPPSESTVDGLRTVLYHDITAAGMVKLGRHCDELRAAGEDAPPLSEAAAIIMTSGVPTDDAATQAELGVTYRPLEQTFRDTLAWLEDTGQLPRARTA